MAELEKTLTQSELPRLGKVYFDLAESIGYAPVDRNMQITALSTDGLTGQITIQNFPHEQTLNGLQVLASLRDMKTYRGLHRETSRENTRKVAALGGCALFEIDSLTPTDGLSRLALRGIQSALIVIHRKMNSSFGGISYPSQRDKEALQSLRTASKILRGY